MLHTHEKTHENREKYKCTFLCFSALFLHLCKNSEIHRKTQSGVSQLFGGRESGKIYLINDSEENKTIITQ